MLNCRTGNRTGGSNPPFTATTEKSSQATLEGFFCTRTDRCKLACRKDGRSTKKTKSARRRSLSFSHIVARAPPARRVGNAGGSIPLARSENRSRTKTLLRGLQSIFAAPSPWWQYTFAHQNPSSHTQNQHQPRHRFWITKKTPEISAFTEAGKPDPAQSENRSRTKTLLCGLQSIFTAPSPWWQYTFAHQNPSTHTQNKHQPRHRFWPRKKTPERVAAPSILARKKTPERVAAPSIWRDIAR